MKKLEDMSKAELDAYVAILCAGQTLDADAWWRLIDAAPKKLARAWLVEQEGTWLQAVRRNRCGEACAEIFNPRHRADPGEVPDEMGDWHGRRDCAAHWEVCSLSYLERWNGCAASLDEAKAAADAALLADGWLLGSRPVDA
jgi:hypothetical protein